MVDAQIMLANSMFDFCANYLFGSTGRPLFLGHPVVVFQGRYARAAHHAANSCEPDILVRNFGDQVKHLTRPGFLLPWRSASRT
jgi:hypothetical protein